MTKIQQSQFTPPAGRVGRYDALLLLPCAVAIFGCLILLRTMVTALHSPPAIETGCVIVFFGSPLFAVYSGLTLLFFLRQRRSLRVKMIALGVALVALLVTTAASLLLLYWMINGIQLQT